MTLQSGLIYQGKGYLWTDNALFEAATGKAICEYPKAFCGEHFRWAAVLSADLDKDDIYSVQRAIGARKPRNTEEMLAAGVAALQVHALKGLMGRLLFCAPEPQHGAMLYLITTDETGLTRPFVPVEMGFFVSHGGDTELGRNLESRGLTPKRMRRFIDVQVKRPSTTVHGNTHRSIGGDIYEIEIADGDVRPRVVRTVSEIPIAA